MHEKLALELFKKFDCDPQLHMEVLDFMDNFGWYCKKYYFDEECSPGEPDMQNKFEDSEFYDLMVCFKGNKRFISFCVFLTEFLDDNFSAKRFYDIKEI